MLAFCEEAVERVGMSLALGEGNAPTLQIDPQRSSSNCCNRSSLPGPGHQWSASSARIVGLIIDALNPEMAVQIDIDWAAGVEHDLSGASATLPH